MKDEEFDKLLKEQMKSDTYIPEKIESFFLILKKIKLMIIIRYISLDDI